MIKDESCLNSPQLLELQKRRKQLEQSEMQRGSDQERNQSLAEQKLQKELEFLIKDKYLIEKRNYAILEELNRVKAKTMNSLHKVKIQNENLVKSKQEIYDYLSRHSPLCAEEFKLMTQCKKNNIQNLAAKQAQIEVKENDLNILRFENKKLNDELELQEKQQVYANLYKKSPFVAQEYLFRLSNVEYQQQQQKPQISNASDLQNQSYSMEKRVLQKYVGQSQSDYDNFDQSFKKQTEISNQFIYQQDITESDQD